MPRDEIWDHIHKGLENLANNCPDQSQLGTEVANLRVSYRSMKTGSKSPDFKKNDTRDAYAIAYHPGHASSYLHIFLNKGVGDKLGITNSSSFKVGVLGAGCAAETLALIHFMKDRSLTSAHLGIGLVDRADWSQQRKYTFSAPMSLLELTVQPQIDIYTYDLLTQSGNSFMKTFLRECDLVFCPAIFTELEAKGRGNGSKLIQDAVDSLKAGAKLLLVDETDINNFDEYRQRLVANGNVTSITSDQADIAVPQPPKWLIETVLNYSNNRIPRASYRLSWALLQKN